MGSSLVLAIALAWCGAVSAAVNMTNADTSPQDILSKIHTTNQNEIRMAKLALQKGHSPEVKKFAQRMIKDHTMADQKVMKIAKEEGLTLGQYPLTAHQQGQMDKLASTTGTEFDKAYMEANRVGHHKAVDMLKNAEAQTNDPRIKRLVSQLLPTVEHHDQMAEQIHPGSGKSAS
jgi:putative membrane protein